MGVPQGLLGSVGNGVCPNHIVPLAYYTVLVTGAATDFTNMQPSAIVSCLGVSSCGHTTIAIVGSATVFKTMQPAHRVGDIGQNYGQYVLTVGSPNVFTGG